MAHIQEIPRKRKGSMRGRTPARAVPVARWVHHEVMDDKRRIWDWWVVESDR